MKGFLRKDWYLVKDYWLPYIPILLFACLVPGTWGGTYILMLALALPRATIASDEVRWDRLAVMLPCRAEEMVRSKYLLYGACILFGMVMSAVSLQTQRMAGRLLTRWWENVFSMTLPDILRYVLLQGGFSLLIAALTVPLYYRFTARKGAVWGNILVFIFLSAASTVTFTALRRGPWRCRRLCWPFWP